MQVNCLNFLEPQAQGRLFFTLILIDFLTLASEPAFRFGACRFNSQKAEASVRTSVQSGLSGTVSLMATAEPIQFSFYSSPQFMILKGVPGVFGEKMRSEPLCQSCRNCEVPGKKPGAGVEAEEQHGSASAGKTPLEVCGAWS